MHWWNIHTLINEWWKWNEILISNNVGIEFAAQYGFILNSITSEFKNKTILGIEFKKKLYWAANFNSLTKSKIFFLYFLEDLIFFSVSELVLGTETVLDCLHFNVSIRCGNWVRQHGKIRYCIYSKRPGPIRIDFV